MIPYGRQSISDRDIQAVVEVLRSDWSTTGPKVPAFDQAVADYCGACHGVAVSSDYVLQLDIAAYKVLSSKQVLLNQ